MLLDLHEQENDRQACSDFRDLAFEDEDFLFLFNPELDGIDTTRQVRQLRPAWSRCHSRPWRYVVASARRLLKRAMRLPLASTLSRPV